MSNGDTCPAGTRPQAATITNAPIATNKARMLFTSPPIHRRRAAGSRSGKRGCDLERLGFREIALDPNDRAVVVEDERIRRQAEGLVAEVSVGVGEEECGP